MIYPGRPCAALASALRFNYDDLHLPCENSAHLALPDAEAMAVALRSTGARVEIIATETVAGVRHRADECWPTHIASSGEAFTARHGVVVRRNAVGLAADLARFRERAPDAPLWCFEIFQNHEHPSNDFDRNALRAAREAVADLRAALRECFPERRFLVVRRAEQVSFCRATDDLPRGSVRSDRGAFDLRLSGPIGDSNRYCERCKTGVAFRQRTEPDAEFPFATFAECPECGTEILVDVDDEHIPVGPETGFGSVPNEP